MFAAAYETNRHWTAEASFEAHPVAVAIVDFMGNNARQTRIWEGTATELLAEINDISTKDIRRTHGWPRTANALGSVIEQVMPLLWLKGIGVSKRHTGDRRVISLTCAEG